MVAGRQGDDPGIGRDRPGCPPRGEVPDLWSLPSGAVSLGDEVLDQDSALDRLAAVLPVLGEDFPLEVAQEPPGGPFRPSGDFRGAPDPSPDTGRSPATGMSRPGAATDRSPFGHRALSTPPARVLSFRALMVLLVAVYLAVVVIGLGVTMWRRGAEAQPAEVDIDGPIACPMHRVAQQPQAETDGTCFFVG